MIQLFKLLKKILAVASVIAIIVVSFVVPSLAWSVDDYIDVVPWQSPYPLQSVYLNTNDGYTNKRLALGDFGSMISYSSDTVPFTSHMTTNISTQIDEALSTEEIRFTFTPDQINNDTYRLTTTFRANQAEDAVFSLGTIFYDDSVYLGTYSQVWTNDYQADVAYCLYSFDVIFPINHELTTYHVTVSTINYNRFINNTVNYHSRVSLTPSYVPQGASGFVRLTLNEIMSRVSSDQVFTTITSDTDTDLSMLDTYLSNFSIDKAIFENYQVIYHIDLINDYTGTVSHSIQENISFNGSQQIDLNDFFYVDNRTIIEEDFDWWSSFTNGIKNLLSIQILPNLPIGYILIIPVAWSLFNWLLKLFAGG